MWIIHSCNGVSAILIKNGLIWLKFKSSHYPPLYYWIQQILPDSLCLLGLIAAKTNSFPTLAYLLPETIIV
jgi:hypothetical protein